MSKVDEFKYLVAFDPKRGVFVIGHTRTWRYHLDIFNSFPAGFIPYGAGLFSINGDDVESIKVYGKSEGFSIGPSFQDLDFLKMYMGDDHDDTFDKQGNPVCAYEVFNK